MGTVNVLEAIRRRSQEVLAIVLVTSDKCYENPAGGRDDSSRTTRSAGSDPYSSSKACAELVPAPTDGRSSPERTRHGSPPRARATSSVAATGARTGSCRTRPRGRAGEPLAGAQPGAVRPWQHVLSPLGGYLRLARRLRRRPPRGAGGPGMELRARSRTRDRWAWIVQRLAELWDGELRWQLDEASEPAGGRPPGARLQRGRTAPGVAPGVAAGGCARAGRRVAPGPPQGGGHAACEPRADRAPRLGAACAPACFARGRCLCENAEPDGRGSPEANPGIRGSLDRGTKDARADRRRVQCAGGRHAGESGRLWLRVHGHRAGHRRCHPTR